MSFRSTWRTVEGILERHFDNVEQSDVEGTVTVSDRWPIAADLRGGMGASRGHAVCHEDIPGVLVAHGEPDPGPAPPRVEDRRVEPAN